MDLQEQIDCPRLHYINARYNGETIRSCIYVGKITQNPNYLELNNKNEFVEKYIKEKVAPKFENINSNKNNFKENLKEEKILRENESIDKKIEQKENSEEEQEI